MAVLVEVEGAAVDHVRVGIDVRRGRHVHVQPVGLHVERPGPVHLLQDVAVKEGPVERHVVQVDERGPVAVPDAVQQLVVDGQLGHRVRPQHQLLASFRVAVVRVHGPHVVVHLVEVVVPHPGELALLLRPLMLLLLPVQEAEEDRRDHHHHHGGWEEGAHSVVGVEAGGWSCAVSLCGC